tara:strand:+ start:93 stop:524 length:432 start_codon:yes stop_codon:yes gene_type:complete
MFSFANEYPEITSIENLNFKQKNILRLVKIQYKDTIKEMIDLMVGYFGDESIKKLRGEELDFFINELINSDELYLGYIPFYDKNFTDSEIIELLTFNESNTGKKYNSLLNEEMLFSVSASFKSNVLLKNKADDIIEKMQNSSK